MHTNTSILMLASTRHHFLLLLVTDTILMSSVIPVPSVSSSAIPSFAHAAIPEAAQNMVPGLNTPIVPVHSHVAVAAQQPQHPALLPSQLQLLQQHIQPLMQSFAHQPLQPALQAMQTPLQPSFFPSAQIQPQIPMQQPTLQQPMQQPQQPLQYAQRPKVHQASWRKDDNTNTGTTMVFDYVPGNVPASSTLLVSSQGMGLRVINILTHVAVVTVVVIGKAAGAIV